MNNLGAARQAMMAAGILILVWVALLAGAIFVALHFIAKLW